MKFCKAVMATVLLLFMLVSCSKSLIENDTSTPTASPEITQDEIETTPSPALKTPTVQNQNDYSSDAMTAVTEIENTHPIFLTGELPDNYNSFRDEYLAYSSKPLTKIEFLLATQKYLTILSDGHMGGGLIQDGLYIDVEWVSVESKIYLVDENGKLSDTEVTEIGGVPLKNVMLQVDTYYFAENDAARQRQYAAYCRQEEMLALSRCKFNENSVTLTLQKNGITSTMECNLIRKKRSSIYYKDSPAYIIKHRMIDDVFYIDLRTFKDDKSVDDTVIAIKEAIGNGIYKFIIDIRDNGGGNSVVGGKLLDAMGMSVPSYGGYVRFSDLVKAQRGESNEENFVFYEPTVESAQSNSNILLSVLTNNITFSSATMLGVWVQDGKLGNIVGQPSSNSPTSYGDMLGVRLPISGVEIPISYKKFLRPDSKADPTTLHPDILVSLNEDALEIALKHLRSM